MLVSRLPLRCVSLLCLYIRPFVSNNGITPISTHAGRDALWARHGKKYDYGPGGATLYPAAGAEDDWARSKAGIKYSFTLELRPGLNKL